MEKRDAGRLDGRGSRVFAAISHHVVVPTFGSKNAVPDKEQENEPKWNFHVKMILRFAV